MFPQQLQKYLCSNEIKNYLSTVSTEENLFYGVEIKSTKKRQNQKSFEFSHI